MSEPTNPTADVLHNQSHAKLSDEEVAKAVARHNKNHSGVKTENPNPKAKKTKKG